MSQVAQTGRFFRRWWPVVLAAAVMLVIAAFVSLLLVINHSAHSFGSVAQQQYAGDEVEALISAVADEHATLRDRNHAVWALGQFRDPRALPVLRRHYTGEKCQHDQFLCQYELKKATDLCSGKTSAPGWFQRATAWALPKARSKA